MYIYIYINTHIDIYTYTQTGNTTGIYKWDLSIKKEAFSIQTRGTPSISIGDHWGKSTGWIA